MHDNISLYRSDKYPEEPFVSLHSPDYEAEDSINFFGDGNHGQDELEITTIEIDPQRYKY